MTSLAPEPVIVANEILTVGEVALPLKVAEKTVYPIAQCAESRGFKGRRQRRFRRRDIDEWIAAQVRRPCGARAPRESKGRTSGGTNR